MYENTNPTCPNPCAIHFMHGGNKCKNTIKGCDAVDEIVLL